MLPEEKNKTTWAFAKYNEKNRDANTMKRLLQKYEVSHGIECHQNNFSSWEAETVPLGCVSVAGTFACCWALGATTFLECSKYDQSIAPSHH